MRSLAEWLVLPLFLLPVLAVAGLGLLARERHRTSLDAYRADGRAEAGRWLAEPAGPAAWMPERFLRDLAPSGDARGPSAWRIAFQDDAAGGEVLLGPHALGDAPWRIAGAYPVGLSAAALADAEVRLRVEVGNPPLAVAGVDEATLALRALLASPAPDLEALRTARLPAATKRYVLGRWRRGRAEDARLADAGRLLRAIAALEEDIGAGKDARGPGAWPLGDALLLSGGGAWPVLLAPEPARLPPLRLTARGEGGEGVRLVYAPAAGGRTSPGTVLWEGRLETPLAGTWRFVADEDGWWAAPAVRRWRAPVLVLAGLLLALPATLFVSLRRRRLREEARVRFLNEIAHDLRTPLTSLRLHADLLWRGTGDEAKRARHLATVTREAARLTGLLANLLDLARLETGRRRLEIAPLSVRDVAEEAVLDFRAAHPARAGDLVLDGDPRVRVRADRAGLARALANLLDNAGKFTVPGTTIRCTWRREGTDVAIAVADEGPGIPPAERRRVFRRYVRGRDAKAAAVPGTGLGLALVAELVAEMGGTAALADAAKGTTLEIRLPGGGDA